MRIPAGWLIAALALPVPLTAQAQLRGAMYTGLTYSWSLPVGDTKDFIDNDSWLGFNLEGGRFLNDNSSVGLFLGWNEFYEQTNEEITFTGGSVSGGAQYRHIGMFPMLLNYHYYFGEPGGTRPYLGLSGGVYYMRQLLDIGLSEFTGDAWLFGVAPEAGIAVPVRYGTAFVASARYNLPAKGSDFLGGDKSLQSWSISIGVAYGR